jgi:DNA ligase-associated metallophosphoesterase
VDIAGERLVLLPERAIYWPARETLILADTHWGKAATLRAAAIPIPGGTTKDSLTRLSAVLDRTQAKRAVVLGDVFHAKQGRAEKTLAALREWREQRLQLEMLLVRGNHDRHAGDPPEELRIHCVNSPEVDGPFVYRHFPKDSEAGFTLSGHTHPAIRLRGRGAERTTLPCFWFTDRVGILPAFGTFTGTAKIAPGQNDHVFAIAGDEVIRV